MDIQTLTRRTDGWTNEEKGTPGGTVERGSLTHRSMDSTNMNKRGGRVGEVRTELMSEWVSESVSEWEGGHTSESVKSDAAYNIS
jgi:hypothetical protein